MSEGGREKDFLAPDCTARRCSISRDHEPVERTQQSLLHTHEVLSQRVRPSDLQNSQGSQRNRGPASRAQLASMMQTMRAASAKRGPQRKLVLDLQLQQPASPSDAATYTSPTPSSSAYHPSLDQHTLRNSTDGPVGLAMVKSITGQVEGGNNALGPSAETAPSPLYQASPGSTRPSPTPTTPTQQNASTRALRAGRREGWVWKRGHLNTAFRQRYFVLSDGVLRYYLDKDHYYGSRPPQGTLNCAGLSVESLGLCEHGFEFSFRGEDSEQAQGKQVER